MFSGIPIEKGAVISVVLLIFLFVNVIVLIAVFLDLMFGFTTKSFIKNTTPYLKIKNYDLLTPVFEDLKLQFNRNDVELMVSNSEQINAFAVGNFKKQYVIITKGLVSCYLMANKGNIKKF
ncbi:MAG: M48 family metalloprotease, partial [Rickettsiales bacterium]|nr:M48 family metalloprotease [Rickettsiales bacterium]